MLKTKILLIGFLVNLAFAQEYDFLNNMNCVIQENECYDTFDRTKFDIIMPQSDKPTPLVIYIHGGGFTHGDKSKGYTRKDEILHYLQNNIAFATINYRFYNRDDSVGVNLCLKDVKTAIQHIRHQADKYNIDKNRIGCYGVSAGAGSSLFLAFHDDMALENDTTLLGESTRILCAGALSTQATYNILRWRQFIPGLRLVLLIKGKTFYQSIANFYGYASYHDLKPEHKRVAQNLDLLNMIDPSDPPVYIMNMQTERFPKNNNIIQHHRRHAKILAKKLSQNKIEHYLFVPDRNHKTESDAEYKVETFMAEHLTR